jgi:hypothetical protein
MKGGALNRCCEVPSYGNAILRAAWAFVLAVLSRESIRRILGRLKFKYIWRLAQGLDLRLLSLTLDDRHH